MAMAVRKARDAKIQRTSRRPLQRTLVVLQERSAEIHLVASRTSCASVEHRAGEDGKQSSGGVRYAMNAM